MSGDVSAGAHPLTLSFRDPSLERRFWDEHALDLRGYNRFSLSTLLVLFTACVALDAAVFPEHLGALVVLRFGLAVPVLFAGVAVVWHDRFFSFYRRRAQEILLAVACALGLTLLLHGTIALKDLEGDRLHVSGLGMLTMLIFLYTLSRLRWAYTVPVAIAFSAGSLGLRALSPSAGPLVPAMHLFVVAFNVAGAWGAWSLERRARHAFVTRLRLEEARLRCEALLCNALPREIVENLAGRAAASADREALAVEHDEVTVVIADIAGFTRLAERLPLPDLARLLDRIFSRFDALAIEHGVEKLKTLGDAWVAVAGAPHARPDDPEAAVRLALDLVRSLDEMNPGLPAPVAVRVGVHTGPAVAGVIGRTRFAYDLWGEAVTGAAEAERTGRPGSVHVSARTAERLGGRFVLEEEDAHGAFLTGHLDRASFAARPRSTRVRATSG